MRKSRRCWKNLNVNMKTGSKRIGSSTVLRTKTIQVVFEFGDLQQLVVAEREMSKNSIIQKVEEAQLKTDIPEFSPGDTVVVQVRIKEGERERLQAFEGVVLGKRNRGLNSAFTVRKLSHGVGVERTFQTHSNLIESIQVKRRGDVRQAKLYYLRDRSGRSARIAEKLEKKA